MGLFDKFKKSAPEVKEKAEDLVGQHADKIDGAVDKVADLADKATGGKHSSAIDNAADKVKDAADKLAGDDK